MIRRWRMGLLAAVLLAPCTAHAQDETRASIDVSPGVGYSSNPFSGTGGDRGSGYAVLDVSPRLQLLMPQDTLTLSGTGSFQKYFRRYSDSDSYRVSADYAGKPSARLSAHARVDISSSIIGAFDTVNNGFFDPITGVPAPTDFGLFGSRDRRRGVYATGDFSAALSARDSITASSFYEVGRYDRFAAISNYDGFGGTLGYNRQLNSTLRAGLRGSVSRYTYPGARGNTDVVSINATGSGKINEYWTVDGAIGASFVNSSTRASTGKASLSGNVNLCRQGVNTNFCFNASRSVRPTGYNGSQYVTSVGASWSAKVSQFDTVSWSASYNKENGSRSLLFPGIESEYYSANANYARRLSERLRLTATASYRDISNANFNRKADIGGRLSLSYHFGDL